MGEGVFERLERQARVLDQPPPRPPSAGGRRLARQVARRLRRLPMRAPGLGQAPKAAPDAGGRALLQQHFVAAQEHEHRDLPQGRRPGRPRRRQLAGAPGRGGHAARGHRALCAARPTARAHGRTEVHQPLRVRADVARRQFALGERPERSLGARSPRIPVDSREATQHPLDVAVQDRGPGAERERRDRAGGRTADPGQRGERLDATREFATEGFGDTASAGVQVARPAVVAQAAPGAQHVFLGRRRQRRDVGKALDEAQVVRDHRGHLRLLQHDLRHPDPVGVGTRLPRQVVPAVRALPADDPVSEPAHGEQRIDQRRRRARRANPP